MSSLLRRVLAPLALFGVAGLAVAYLLDHLEAQLLWEVLAQIPQTRGPRVVKIIEISDNYNPHGGRHFNHLSKCKPACKQASSVYDADVVFAYSGKDRPRRTRHDQVWVATFWESPQHYPALRMDWDYTSSYRRDATFPHFEMIPMQFVDMLDGSLERLRQSSPWPRKVSWQEKRKEEHLITVWISNCAMDKTKRLNTARELDKAGVHFSSFGHCLKNSKTEAQKNRKDSRWRQKPRPKPRRLRKIMADVRRARERRLDADFLRRTSEEPSQRDLDMYDTSSRFMFFYAAENSRCAYYHTEKVYHGLLAGSIPIYLGADTISEAVPRGSIIRANEFRSTKDLAAYIKRVAANETLYNSYFNWWHENLQETSPIYVSLLKSLRDGRKQEKLCEMCTFFHEHGRNSKSDPKLLQCGL